MAVSTPEDTMIVRIVWLVLCLGMPMWAASSATFAHDAAGDHRDREETLMFQIAPQPLKTALRAYSEMTGQTVLVDVAILEGRESPGVQGNYEIGVALQRLLAGTGLVASYAAHQAFTLKLATPVESDEPRAVEPLPSADQGSELVTQAYAGQLQGAIESALCARDQTRLGDYRLALQVWIASDGKIERTRMLSAVDDTRASAVDAALSSITLEPLPAGVPQPLTLLLLPHRAARCEALSRR